MSLLQDWRNDRLAIVIAIATAVSSLSAPFLASATSELPSWTNFLIGILILPVGGAAAYWRLRRSASGDVKNTETSVAKLDEPVDQVDQGDRIASTPRWQVVEDSLRRAPIISGEGPVVLLGYAEVAAAGPRETDKLYYCKLVDVKTGHSYFEFRVNPPPGRLVKRESEIRLLPGEIITSKRVWLASDGSANNNVVADWQSVTDESRELIESSESMVIVWNDTVSLGGESFQTKTHRLVVPVAGLSDVENKLNQHRMHNVPHFSPV